MSVFYGIGVGPGNEKMITLEAVEILKEIELLFVPTSRRKKPSRALRISKQYLREDVAIVELYFPMNFDDDWDKHWKENAQTIMSYADRFDSMAMVTIGDPMIYSTYAYLLDYLDKEKIEIRTISGIPSFCSAAASTNESIVQGDKSFVVLTALESKEELKHHLRYFSRLVFMKIPPYWSLLIDVLQEEDLGEYCTWVTKASDQEQTIYHGIPEQKVGYFTILIIRKEQI